MTDSVEIDIRGLAETQRALYQFSDQLGDRVTLFALRAGAKFILKKTREAAPIKTGRLRKAIVIKNSQINRRRKNGKVGVYMVLKAGKKRTDMKGAWYGKFVENGYNTGSSTVSHSQAGITNDGRLRRRVDRRFSTSTRRYNFTGKDIPGKKFIKSTFEANKQQSLDIVLAAIEQGGQTLVNEIQRR